MMKQFYVKWEQNSWDGLICSEVFNAPNLLEAIANWAFYLRQKGLHISTKQPLYITQIPTFMSRKKALQKYDKISETFNR